MSQKIGLWLIGAHGGVATTVAIGLAALKNNASRPWGLVSSLPPFCDLNLVDWQQFVLAGHEIRRSDSFTEARKLANGSSAIRPDLIEIAETELRAFDQNIQPGVLFHAGSTIEGLATPGYSKRFSTPRDAIDQIQSDLQSLIDREGLERLLVVNLASTEPAIEPAKLPTRWAALSTSLSSTNCDLPTSSLYAIAALEMRCPYINFTPSLGSSVSSIEELAIERGTCHAGRDGKTGETFLKSVLAPAFQQRNLEIMSWVGHNIFGNMDGIVLNDPANKQTKIKSKDQLLEQILGYSPQTLVSIEYIRSLGDWKTAWDHIHFRGFLGTPMIMTFTWQGCDSILAAPLVLDLCRFTELAARDGASGSLTWLASFFKSPQGTSEHNFQQQYQMLLDWAMAKYGGQLSSR
jgi:myo-inositol-1-phosphate synthase